MKKTIKLTESELISIIEKIVAESKGEKWVQSTMKKPGSLKKSMGKGKEEKISKSELDSEMVKLRKTFN